MPQWKALLSKHLGYEDVATYIQSGNAVFTVPRVTDAAVLAADIEAAVAEYLDVSVPAVVVEAEAWRDLAQANPWVQANPAVAAFLHLGFLRESLPPEIDDDLLSTLNERARGDERVGVFAGHLLLFLPDGVGRTKLTTDHLEKAVGSHVTMRNWNTVIAVDRLLG